MNYYYTIKCKHCNNEFKTDEFKKCFVLKNLQHLLKQENFDKGRKVVII